MLYCNSYVIKALPPEVGRCVYAFILHDFTEARELRWHWILINEEKVSNNTLNLLETEIQESYITQSSNDYAHMSQHEREEVDEYNNQIRFFYEFELCYYTKTENEILCPRHCHPTAKLITQLLDLSPFTLRTTSKKLRDWEYTNMPEYLYCDANPEIKKILNYHERIEYLPLLNV